MKAVGATLTIIELLLVLVLARTVPKPHFVYQAFLISYGIKKITKLAIFNLKGHQFL